MQKILIKNTVVHVAFRPHLLKPRIGLNKLPNSDENSAKTREKSKCADLPGNIFNVSVTYFDLSASLLLNIYSENMEKIALLACCKVALGRVKSCGGKGERDEKAQSRLTSFLRKRISSLRAFQFRRRCRQWRINSIILPSLQKPAIELFSFSPRQWRETPQIGSFIIQPAEAQAKRRRRLRSGLKIHRPSLSR
jgi:hypothetical protein